MQVRVLGSAAGGGLPQWNCRCPNCEASRSGSPEVDSRTQSSVAVSADGEAWFLLNVSPDIRSQILAFPALTPTGIGPRGTAIAGCVLTDAELDHASGLLLLREGCAFGVYSSPLVRRWLEVEFPIEPIISRFARRPWTELPLGELVPLRLPSGDESGLAARAFDLDPHIPKYVAAPPASAEGSVIGLEIVDARSGGRLVYAPGVASLHPSLREAVHGADALLIDGTFWSDDEPIRLGISERGALAMGHWPVGGEGGSLSWLAELPIQRRLYVHMNNTNPMLNRAGAEYDAVARAGVAVGRDGDAFEIPARGV